MALFSPDTRLLATAPLPPRLWLRACGSLRTLTRRDFDGLLYSTKNSGTHWLRYLLGQVLAGAYGVAPPEHINSFRLVGHPVRPPAVPDGVPKLVHAHYPPHPALRLRQVFDWQKRPRYLFLVRDFRAILVSVFEKCYREHGRLDFATFLRGNPRDPKALVCDIWELMRFCNGWGPIIAAHPGRCLVVRYEDLLADTAPWLRRICRFLGIKGADDGVIARAITASTKDRMAARLDPTERNSARVVRAAGRSPLSYYGWADREFLRALTARHLRYSFGYDYGVDQLGPCRPAAALPVAPGLAEPAWAQALAIDRP
jgi:hypothetical protein